LIQCRDEMHLARSGIGKAGIDPGPQQRFNQTPCAVHFLGLLPICFEVVGESSQAEPEFWTGRPIGQ